MEFETGHNNRDQTTKNIEKLIKFNARSEIHHCHQYYRPSKIKGPPFNFTPP